MVTLHGRTRVQAYKGFADWDLVREIKRNVSIPVSGSGDITSIQQAFDRFRETGCDGVLIGRGAMANPWIFRQIEDTMHGREPFQPTLADKRAALLEYFEMLREDMPQMAAIGRMKQLAGPFAFGRGNSRTHLGILRNNFCRAPVLRRGRTADNRSARVGFLRSSRSRGLMLLKKP